VAKKSTNFVALAAYAVVGYLAYENWPTISAWFSSLVPSAAAASTTPASAYYPNSPVPSSYSTSQNFVDSSGNIWQYNTQTSQWVIAKPASPAAVPASAGTVVSTAPAVTVPTAPAGTVVTTPPPAAPPAGTVVAITPPPAGPPNTQFILAPGGSSASSWVPPAPSPAQPLKITPPAGGSLVHIIGPFTIAPPATTTPPTPPATILAGYGMPHYRSY
jgi:hypothetical protein